MYVVNGSDGTCIIAVRLIVSVRYLERPLMDVLLYYVLLILCMQYKKWEGEASTLPLCLHH